MKNVFYYATTPVSRVLWRAGDSTSSILSSIFRFQGLSQENNNLKEENERLLAQNASLQETLRQGIETQSALLNTQGDNLALVLAGTIGLDSVGDFIVIDKGSVDGIAENMPVISAQKVLYGRVFKVYKNFSQVMLISNKNSVVDVKIQDSNAANPFIYGAAKGSGSLSLYLDLVSSEAEIKEGDVLVTSALEGVFPKDLLVGKLILKNKNDLKPFQTAGIQPFFDVNAMDNVFVVTNYMKK